MLWWPQNGIFVISQNTKADKIKFKFCEISLNFTKGFCRNFMKFHKTLFVLCKICLCYEFHERNLAKFCQILMSRNNFAHILQNFAIHFLYFAKFCCINTFMNEIAKFCQILSLRQRFCFILSNTQFCEEISQN